jgi:hypothetical protein
MLEKELAYQEGTVLPQLRAELSAAQKRLESATKLIKLADEVIGCTAMQDFAVWLRETNQ